jgi:hypothetical protein
VKFHLWPQHKGHGGGDGFKFSALSSLVGGTGFTGVGDEGGRLGCR